MYSGTTYYYRGAVNNNWVKFAGMYWRIIRFNGDGSIRMDYHPRITFLNVSVAIARSVLKVYWFFSLCGFSS